MKPGQPAGVLFDYAGVELYGADRMLLERAVSLKARGRALQVVLPGSGPLHDELTRAGVALAGALEARRVPGDEGRRFMGYVEAGSGRTLQVDAIFVRPGAAPAA